MNCWYALRDGSVSVTGASMSAPAARLPLIRMVAPIVAHSVAGSSPSARRATACRFLPGHPVPFAPSKSPRA